jgi:hypothetical protein
MYDLNGAPVNVLPKGFYVSYGPWYYHMTSLYPFRKSCVPVLPLANFLCYTWRIFVQFTICYLVSLALSVLKNGAARCTISLWISWRSSCGIQSSKYSCALSLCMVLMSLKCMCTMWFINPWNSRCMSQLRKLATQPNTTLMWVLSYTTLSIATIVTDLLFAR